MIPWIWRFFIFFIFQLSWESKILVDYLHEKCMQYWLPQKWEKNKEWHLVRISDSSIRGEKKYYHWIMTYRLYFSRSSHNYGIILDIFLPVFNEDMSSTIVLTWHRTFKLWRWCISLVRETLFGCYSTIKYYDMHWFWKDWKGLAYLSPLEKFNVYLKIPLEKKGV